MRMRWAAYVARIVRNEKILPENILVYLKATEYTGVYWIYLTQDCEHWRALVSTVMNLVIL
jgi:hypothetical protein